MRLHPPPHGHRSYPSPEGRVDASECERPGGDNSGVSGPHPSPLFAVLAREPPSPPGRDGVCGGIPSLPRGFIMLNRQGRPTEAGEAEAPAHETFTGNRALQVEEALIFEVGRTEVTGVDRRRAGGLHAAPRRSGTQGADRAARPHRAGDDAALRAAVAEELRHRHRPVPARLLHDEAQPAHQREDGAAARLRRHPSVAAAVDRPRRDRADRRAGALAARAHRHAGGRDDAEGRRARRAVRHDGDQVGAGGARREALARRRAGIGARHQPGDCGGCSAIASRPCRRATTARSIRTR